MRRNARRASPFIALVAALALAGCAENAPAPLPSGTPTPVPTPTATTAPPELVEGGTAGQNRPYFEFVLEGLLAGTPQPGSGQLVDALAAAGFDKAQMQVTADVTPTRTRADVILVSVQISGQCLIASVGDDGLTTDLADVLGTGACLVGRTLSIDW